MYHVIFLGTPQFAVPALKALALHPDFSVDLVITQPDTLSGRGMELRPPAVKVLATELGLPVLQPEKLRTEENLELLRSYKPDFMVVVAYGKIISQSFLDIPVYGTINIHGSLLPKYRGASPVQAALLAGEMETGVSLMLLTKGMDEGPVLRMTHTVISPDMTSATLFEKLAQDGADILPDTLCAFAEKNILPQEQNHSYATYCTKISKEDGRINWESDNADAIHHKWQAFTPWPGIFTTVDGKLLKIQKLYPSKEHSNLLPGKILFVNKQIYIGTKSGALELLELQIEGKKAMSSRDFINGNQNMQGVVCG